jgi:hypothetical protein
MVRPLSLFGIDACLVPFFQLIEPPVIPAKARIYSAKLRECAVDGLGSRFRGNPIPVSWVVGQFDPVAAIPCLRDRQMAA